MQHELKMYLLYSSHHIAAMQLHAAPSILRPGGVPAGVFF